MRMRIINGSLSYQTDLYILSSMKNTLKEWIGEFIVFLDLRLQGKNTLYEGELCE